MKNETEVFVMKDKTYHAYLDSHERQLVIHSLVQADEELTQDKITGADPLCGFTPVIQLSKEVVKCRIIGLCKT